MRKFHLAVLAVFGLILMAGSSFAQSAKIELGEGRFASKVQSGQRVRVNVDFALPPAEMPEGAERFVFQRDMIADTRKSLLEGVFGNTLSDTSKAPSKSIVEGPILARKLDNVPSMAMELTLSEMEKLAADPRVTRIYQDFLSRPTLDESTVLIGAPVVWASGSDGTGVAVAVLDTGSSHQHVMMAGRVVGSACFSTTSAGANSTSFCPGGTNSEISASAGENCPVDDPATNDNDPSTTDDVEGIDGCNHGTHVASTAMGNTMTEASGRVLNGVATGGNLVAVQVFSQFNDAADCDPDGTPPDPASAPCVLSFGSDQRAGLDYVINNAATLNIASVNMSLGGGPEITSASVCDNQNLAMKSLIDQLRTLGVATVIASGNESFDTGVTAPGCISSAVTVGSTTKSDTLSSFSNSSELVDLLAPGSSIRAAYPFVGGKSYAATLSGTSMATPHVAGAFALLRSKFPGATVDEIENALIATGIPINDGRINSIIKPRIRVDLAANVLASGGVGLGDVALAPIAGFLATGDLADLATFSTKTYTLTNNGAASANFTVAGDKNWLGFDKTSGSIAAGASTNVVVSVITANVVPGQTDTGVITFTVASNSTTRAASLSVATPLLNDNIADAFPLSGITVSTSGTNVGASFETGETEHNPEFTDTGGSSVWFEWTAPFNVNITVDTTGSTFDTVMSIYTGNTVTALTFVAGNDDSSGAGSPSIAPFDAIEGTTYYIVIDGFNGGQGNYALALFPTAAATQDTFASATAISGATGNQVTHNNKATAETGEPSHAGQAATSSIWFDWTAPSDGDFTFHTDGTAFDSILAVYTGTAVNALTPITSNNNQGAAGFSKPAFTPGASQVTFTATSGQSYKITVDGVNGATGTVLLSWFSAATPQPVLFTAVLPNARSVKIGQTATGFMTVINASTTAATACELTLPLTDFVGGFNYQTVDATNTVVGTPDADFGLSANGSQAFVFGVTPSATFSEEILTPVAVCVEGTSSLVTTGVNTFTLSSSAITPADMLTISLSPATGGINKMQSASDNGFIVVATAAIGADATLTFSVNDGGAGLPFVSSVCETNPATGVCLTMPTQSVTFNSVGGETRTFASFVSATGNIPFDASNNRFFMEFRDQAGILRGGSSVEIRTDFVAPDAPGRVVGLE